MNVIKGLITKDILQLKSYKKTLIIFIMIFALTSISAQDGVENMLVIMLTLGFGMFSMASFNYDEFNKADRYILTLPLTKKEVILSKYILVICSTVIGSVIGILLSYIVIFAMNKQVPNIEEIISIGLGGIFGIGIIEAIQIPCVYKWGAEKGRIQMLILTAVLGAILCIVAKADIQLPANNILNIFNTFLPLIFIVLTIIIYYISYKVAYKIYDKKEI